jgi:molecular chaperone DnaJ
MAQKDYYKTLGISKTATQDEIKKAYLSLAKKYHPDINKTPEAKKMFQDISEAFSTLKEEKSRANYDRFGTAEPGGFSSGGFEGFSGFSSASGGGGFDFFSDIMEQFFGYNNAGKKKQQKADMLYKASITLEEAFFGKEIELRIEKEESCKPCSGSGYTGPIKNCTNCNGRG